MGHMRPPIEAGVRVGDGIVVLQGGLLGQAQRSAAEALFEEGAPAEVTGEAEGGDASEAEPA